MFFLFVKNFRLQIILQTINYVSSVSRIDLEPGRDGRSDTDPHPEKNLANGASAKAAGDHVEDVTTAPTTISKKVRSKMNFVKDVLRFLQHQITLRRLPVVTHFSAG